MNDQANR